MRIRHTFDVNGCTETTISPTKEMNEMIAILMAGSKKEILRFPKFTTKAIQSAISE